MTRSSHRREPRWGVRIERNDASKSSTLRQRHRPRRGHGFRVFVMSTFLLHLIVYGVIIMMLLMINILAWEGFLWAVFPAVGWGAALAIHGGVAWLTANAGAPGRMVERAQQPVRLPVVGKANAADDNLVELRGLMSEGLTKVDEMRSIGRSISSPAARRNALHAVSSIEETLVALDENVDELPLAREFVGSLVDPAHRVFVEYSRLAGRDIQGAKALLQQVEQVDLPRITAKAEQVHDRVHRGTMIDLEVAREMLSLGRENRPGE